MIRYLVLILCLFFANLGFSEESIPKRPEGLVAIVNNDIITRRDLDAFINFMRMQLRSEYSEEETEERIDLMQVDLIEKLIEDKLILQAAYEEEIVIEQAKVDARLNQIRREYLTEEDLRDALLLQGLTLADVEMKIKEQILMVDIIERKIRSGIEIQPIEITEYYNSNNQDFNRPAQRFLRYALVENPVLGKKIRRTIDGYKDLDDLAVTHYLKIVDLGWSDRKQLKKEITDLVFNLGGGEMATFVEDGDKFYFFEVKEIRPEGKAPIEQVQAKIYDLLFKIKMQDSLVEWLDQLRSEAYILKKAKYNNESN